MTAGPDVAIIECGIVNPHSIGKAVRLLAPGASVSVTGDPAEIRRAGKVVFPGDGVFGHCMGQIDRGGLRGALAEAARTKPFMGIRIGMRPLSGRNGEGDVRGPGILPGQMVAFSPTGDLRISRMGQSRSAQPDGTEWVPARRVPAAVAGPRGRG